MLKIKRNYRKIYFLFDISENTVIVLFIECGGTSRWGAGKNGRVVGTDARWIMKSSAKVPGLEYGVAVTALAVPTLVLGFEFVNAIGLVYGGLIEKLSAVTMILGG